MRQLFIFIVAVLAFNLGSVKAQETFSGQININTSVLKSIELVTVNQMQFGSAQPGQREIYVNPINNLNAGYMIALGSPDAEFRLSFLRQRELNQIDGNGTLVFTYEISGSDDEIQSNSELLETDNPSIRFNSEGRYYFWVGGRIDLENAIPGNYEGDFTIEIDYI